MDTFEFRNPVRLVFGQGAFDQIGERSAEFGGHALLVTGRGSARRSGLLDRAVGRLEDAGVRVTLFEQIMPNPTDGIVDQGGELARSEGVDVIVAVGGGSPMDAAKGIAVAATHDGPIAEFLRVEDRRLPTEATLPIICATTTSGTSSELTPFAVISTTAATMKSAIGNDNIYPKVAIVDPQTTRSCPESVTANTGADVLAHSMEGYFSTEANAVTDLFAEKAIGLVGRWLPKAVQDCEDMQAREMMALANVYAGYVLSNCGASVMHALEHPISAHHPDVAHGAGLAVMFASYARHYWDRDPLKFGRIAHLLGRGVPGAPVEQSAQYAVDGLTNLLSSIGLNIGLYDLGVTREEIPTLVDDALHYMAGAVSKTPADLTRDDLILLMEDSFEAN
ncbi:MAG: iron-containing alcohol dehydrogenase [Armatimonadota bacterium]|jgi:alcohol dehydrogenase